MDETSEIRDRLQRAADDLLEGRVPGPVTGVRLVELAGVKRHRLTHDNPDINRKFQDDAKQLNRHEPAVTELRKKLRTQQERNKQLFSEVQALSNRVDAYATALAIVTEERDRLTRVLGRTEKLAPFSKSAGT
ncbi:hypothetical protein [Nesterenkonia halotolerans]|uniref:Septal ring factor EnvC (AmiA/AmiB activator) n=1 Tax=Nesterenkonia halotolerans TaxID=225325 RepID=A0ABR9J359_9MICC|nr:hypothetical protein [Nesterenkonia halotolerans]MBE1513427.1 septal ring factor EnvC (AmiA/AmiB activator) [Nesterenkonia halotolerans]